MKSLGPTPEQYARLNSHVLPLIAHVVIVAHPDGGDRLWGREAARVLARLEGHHKAVRGNRQDGAPITWSDQKLLMAGELRVLLEELEKSE